MIEHAYSRDDLLGLIANLVAQHCDMCDGVVDSGFIGVHAEAMDCLVAHGLMTPVDSQAGSGRGRRMRWATPEPG